MIKNNNANIYIIDKNILQLHIFLYNFLRVIISNKVNNCLYRIYHNSVMLCWVQASHYWLGMVIQKTSIEKSYEKYLNNDFQCFHTLKVIRMDSIGGLSNFNETKILKKGFAEPTWVVASGSSFTPRSKDW